MNRLRDNTAFLAIILMATNLTFYPTAQAADRSAIWKIVHDRCLPHLIESGMPDPCAKIHVRDDGKADYAVLKDVKGTAHYLIIPMQQISGIEDPDLFRPTALNWFAIAWQARGFLDQATSRSIPEGDVALALNSISGRGQDQLHIHVSCILTNVRTEIAMQVQMIGKDWSSQNIHLGGRLFFAKRIDRSELLNSNIIRLVADEIPGVKVDIGRTTILVAESDINNLASFLLFVGRSDEQSGDRGKAEDLLDDNCEQARR